MFRTILFDIDGVMLSEERYFDASALTIYELLTSPQYGGLEIPGWLQFHPEMNEQEIRSLRRLVFADDDVLRTMKQCGVNANWDMVYLQTAFQLTEILSKLQQGGINLSGIQSELGNGWSVAVLNRIGNLVRATGTQIDIVFGDYASAYAKTKNKQELFSDINVRLHRIFSGEITPFDHEKALWTLGRTCFQEWYLGDKYNPNTRQPGKHGFLADEVPIVDPAALQSLFAYLRESDITIGVGTGRPGIETRVPLELLGWLQYFDDARVSTASDVLEAEQVAPGSAPLSKPHPFAYVRSYLAEPSPVTVLDFPLPLSEEKASETLVVGDSVADLLAARSIGCKFAAVLTGLEGEAARPQFERMGADLILRDVLELKAYV